MQSNKSVNEIYGEVSPYNSWIKLGQNSFKLNGDGSLDGFEQAFKEVCDWLTANNIEVKGGGDHIFLNEGQLHATGKHEEFFNLVDEKLCGGRLVYGSSKS